jgi:hypothetical protein
MREREIVIVSNQIECLKCGDRPYSAHRHDYKPCKCGAVIVDGGTDYLRRAGEASAMRDLSIVLYKDSVEKMVTEAIAMRESGRNDLGIVYGVLRVLRDEGLLKGFIEQGEV